VSRFLDTHHLAVLVKTKRGNRSLRDIAQNLGDISPSTLSRIEHEKMVDVQTFLRICDWLQVAPQAFIQNTDEVREQEMTTTERIEVVLRTDRTLPPESTDALIALLKVTYSNLSRSAHAETQVSAPGTHA
jgi:transcriptional regulator with XRE-family HTH domain